MLPQLSPRVIDQNLLHDSRRQPQQMVSAANLRRCLGQPQVEFQGSCLQRIGAIARGKAVRDSPQLGHEGCNYRGQASAVAFTESTQ